MSETVDRLLALALERGAIKYGDLVHLDLRATVTDSMNSKSVSSLGVRRRCSMDAAPAASSSVTNTISKCLRRFDTRGIGETISARKRRSTGYTSIVLREGK